MRKFRQSPIIVFVQILFFSVIFLAASQTRDGLVILPAAAGEGYAPFAAASEMPATETDSNAFHFLSPLAPNSGDPADLDESLLDYLSVEVCEVNGNTCSIVRTFTSQGSGSEVLRISGGSYIVNWQAPTEVRTNLKTYRVRVEMAGLQLGETDITPSMKGSLGRTWPIRFLVENDPAVRIRQPRSIDKPVWKIVSVLKKEFNLCGAEDAALMAADLEP